ncbi:hypothetical protein BDZ89DRAFT_976253 [Hymenopellis radicata]|nr:hypothetical protein BDZ89DRAFT_976253 [Hymenopellis radicata]
MCSESPTPDSETPPDIAVLHKDFLSLLLLLRASTTKLALAMKPSSPTYSAVHTPLKDTSSHLAAIAHCIHFLRPELHGSILVLEFQRVAIDIINSVRSLLTVLVGLKDGNEYLVQTGELHDLIDTAQSPTGLSVDNVAAIRKKWLQDKGSLEDGLSELNDMLDHEPSEADAEEENDDGWDEFGLGSDASLTPTERERSKKAQTIIRISTLLHTRILRDILSPSPSLVASTSDLDALSPCSSSLLSASDDFIASLYPPHDIEAISAELSSFQEEITALQRIVNAILSTHAVHAQLGGLDLEDASAKPAESSHAKWFRTCFDQILKNISSLREWLASGDIPASSAG